MMPPARLPLLVVVALAACHRTAPAAPHTTTAPVAGTVRAPPDEDAAVLEAAAASLLGAAPHTVEIVRREGNFAILLATHVEPIEDRTTVFEDAALFFQKKEGTWRELHGGCAGMKDARLPRWLITECERMMP